MENKKLVFIYFLLLTTLLTQKLMAQDSLCLKTQTLIQNQEQKFGQRLSTQQKQNQLVKVLVEKQFAQMAGYGAEAFVAPADLVQKIVTIKTQFNASRNSTERMNYIAQIRLLLRAANPSYYKIMPEAFLGQIAAQVLACN